MDRLEINFAERACEKLNAAVRSLAIGSSSLPDRITDAWLYDLMTLMDVHFPWPDLRERWQALKDRVCSSPPLIWNVWRCA